MEELRGKKIDLGDSSTAWWPCHIGSGTQFGKGCNVGAMAHIGRNCKIGNSVRIQGGVYVSDLTEIEDNVFIGPNATILNDKYPPSGNKSFWEKVILKKGCVVGGNSTINPGLIIGSNSVLGSGSVLTKNIPENEVWYGNPAIFKMTRDQYEAKR